LQGRAVLMVNEALTLHVKASPAPHQIKGERAVTQFTALIFGGDKLEIEHLRGSRVGRCLRRFNN